MFEVPDEESMWISDEAKCRALYIDGLGAIKRVLVAGELDRTLTRAFG